MSMNLLQLPYILVAVIMAAQFTNQASYLNPNPLPFIAKSIRGFEFNRYFDYVGNPYTRASVDGAGKKTVVLQGVNVKWVFDLEVNKDLFSPLYQYYDTNFQPQASNLRDCYYHGKVRGYPNSFLALSDCEGLHGMVVFDDYYRYSIHTLLNYNFIIMRENHLFDWVHNNEFITVQPGEKAGQPQKREAETNTEVKVSATNPSNGNNIRRKPEVNTRDAATFIPAKPGKTKNQDSSPVVNIPKADTTKNHKNTFFPPKIQTTTTPVIPPTVVNVEKPNLTKIDTKAPLPPKNTHVPIVSSPVVNDKKPWRNTYGPNRLYNQRRNTQGNGVQPGATNPKKNEPIKPEPNVVSHDKLEYEELLKKRKKAVKDGWRSGRQVDFEKLGLGLPGKFSAASETSKPIATRNLMKRQVGQKRFYDVAFTLGRMAEITNPRHAEQYIADVVNMLQWYYKKFYFNGFSVRLSGAHYLLHHKTLIDFQGLPQIDKGQYYHGVWRNQAFYYSPFKTFDMKFLLSRNLKKSGFFWNGIADIMYYHCNRNNMWGITYIRDDSVTNPYEIVTTLVHEIGHVTGMDHEGKSGCGHEGKTMQSGRSNYIPWRGFSQCSLGKMLCKPQ